MVHYLESEVLQHKVAEFFVADKLVRAEQADGRAPDPTINACVLLRRTVLAALRPVKLQIQSDHSVTVRAQDGQGDLNDPRSARNSSKEASH